MQISGSQEASQIEGRNYLYFIKCLQVFLMHRQGWDLL